MQVHPIGRHYLAHGDCIEVLRLLPESSIDACVTDPPYGLGFMGKHWDGMVPGVDFARELLRVLKPGAHACLFGGTRTYHRLAVALEDAGFEIRDCLSWLYGTGFPKSLDVSKAIDKEAGAERTIKVGERGLAKWKEGARAGVAIKDDGGLRQGFDKVNTLLAPVTDAACQWQGWGTALKPAIEYAVLVQKPLDLKGLCDSLAHKVGESICLFQSCVNAAETSSRSNPSAFGVEFASALWGAALRCNTPAGLSELMATSRSGLAPRSFLSTALSWLDTLAVISKHANTFTTETASGLTTDLKIWSFYPSRTIAESIIEVWTGRRGINPDVSRVANGFCVVEARLKDILEPTVPGSVTSLPGGDVTGPSWEPILLVRKPLIGTVAANVQAHGTGGLNIDACRIEFEFGVNMQAQQKQQQADGVISFSKGMVGTTIQTYKEGGRWPANVCLDEVAAAMLDEQSGTLKSGANPERRVSPKSQTAFGSFEGAAECTPARGADSGGASRFFYTAKPSRAERDLGCDHLPARTGGEATDREDGAPGTTHPRSGAGGGGGARNIHPTVKPSALIRWLLQLVTPPGGVVLDPFCGSGTIFVAAKDLDLSVAAIEREAEYLPIALARGRASV